MDTKLCNVKYKKNDNYSVKYKDHILQMSQTDSNIGNTENTENTDEMQRCSWCKSVKKRC